MNRGDSTIMSEESKKFIKLAIEVLDQENITHACENDLRAKVNGGAKLTPGNVREICKALEQGASNIELGEKYGVHPDTIGRIRRGRSWKEISKDYNIQ